MTAPNQASNDALFLRRTLEATIRTGLVLLLAIWCYQILKPFIIPLVWGVIIAIASYPSYNWLQARLGGQRKTAATIFTLLTLVLLIIPSIMLSETVIVYVKVLANDLSDGSLTIPPPGEHIAAWPVIGEPLSNFWSLASENIQGALEKIGPQLKALAGWMLSAAAGAGLAILQFIAAIIISGFLLANANGSYHTATAIATRLAGDRGEEFADLAENTVRSVARGILGIAFVQSLLAGLGFLVAGIPGAGLWALLCLLLGITQIGIFVVLIPMIIYLFNTADTITAVGFLIWSIPVGLLDNILKPIVLGRGVKVPMVIIFIGAIGGFLTSGIIGLFIGAVIFTLSYELFLAWLHEGPRSEPRDEALAPSLAVNKNSNPG